MDKALRFNNDKLRIDLVPLDVLNSFLSLEGEYNLDYSLQEFQKGKDYHESYDYLLHIRIIGYELIKALHLEIGQGDLGNEPLIMDAGVFEEVAHVFTMGAKKYAPMNWMKGASWLETLGSLLRHYRKFRIGEDLDDESGLHHLAHAIVNAIFLYKFYSLAPWYDDRPKTWLTMPKIVLDIDDVVADFIGAYKIHTNQLNLPIQNWYFSYKTSANLKLLHDNKDFWVNMPVLHKPNFIPHAYVSSREIPIAWTEEFLEKNQFPCRPVYHLGYGESKVEKLKELDTMIFIDDKITNFIEAQKAGITSYLMDSSHNENFNVGHRRIYDLNINKIL